MRFFALTGYLLLLVSCSKPSIVLLSPDGSQRIAVPVDVADTPELREKGLKDRAVLSKDTGVLFAFSDPQILSVSMKDVTIPLEIIFFTAKGEFISSAAMSLCETNRCPTYQSPELSPYALVVPDGFIEAHGVRVGWRMDVEGVRKMVNPK